MGEVLNFNDVLGVNNGEKQNMLGKLLYFSLPSILVEKAQLSELCESMGIYYAGGNRLSVADAFRSATGDIKERVVVGSGDRPTDLSGLLSGQQAHGQCRFIP